VLASLAIGLLAVVASMTAFVVVRESLRGTLQAALATTPAGGRALPAGAAGSARDQLAGPTGGVIVQLYDPLGELLVASEPRFARADAAVPTSRGAAAARDGRGWRGELAGRPCRRR
jgi:hypothetical protein